MSTRSGCLTPAAMLFVVGLLLMFAGGMADKDKYVKYGAMCLAGAVALGAAALYVRWQGWE